MFYNIILFNGIEILKLLRLLNTFNNFFLSLDITKERVIFVKG